MRTAVSIVLRYVFLKLTLDFQISIKDTMLNRDKKAVAKNVILYSIDLSSLPANANKNK